MKEPIFPIVQVDGNKIISTEGVQSCFYKINPSDLEQFDPRERANFWEHISNWMNHLDGKEWFKLYFQNGNAYINSSVSDLSVPSGLSILPVKRPLKTFFGHDEIISDVCFYDNYLTYNGDYVRILSVVEFPDSDVDEGFLPHGVDYVLNFRRIEKEKSIQKIENIRQNHLSSFSKQKRDISGEGTYAQAEDLLENFIFDRESLFEMELYFIVKASSSDELNIKTKQLSTYLLGKGLKTFVEGQDPLKGKSGLGVIFSDLIPGVRPKFNLRNHLDKTSHLMFLLPFSKSRLMKNGVVFHDIQDEEIFFNPFDSDLKNKNMLVTGTSGAGKSVFVNKLVHHLIEDHPTVILDKGGSFKRLSLYHGGEVLSDGFNPFQFKDPFYLREIILSVVDKKKFGKLERGQLLKSIKEGLEKSQSFHDLLNFLERDFPCISSYFEDIKEFLTDSMLDFKPILYVDVENYPKSIISPLIIFLLEYFKNLPVKEKILVFDECWSFLKGHSAYIDECFRTFRKSGGFPIAISQSIKDFENIGSDLFQSITNNSFLKYIFLRKSRQMVIWICSTRKKWTLFVLKKECFQTAI